jgi:hypothetical protein
MLGRVANANRAEKGSLVKRRAAEGIARSQDLIQHRAGVELPASGTWTIASGQPIWAERRGSFRTEEIALRTTHGALVVTADLAIVTLDLGLLASEADEPLTIGFEGHLSSADRLGRWRFDGAADVDGSACPCELALAYQGVHTRGAAPVAWLTIAEAFLTADRSRGRRRARNRGLQITGDLNAHRDLGRHVGASVHDLIVAVHHDDPVTSSEPKSA